MDSMSALALYSSTGFILFTVPVICHRFFKMKMSKCTSIVVTAGVQLHFVHNLLINSIYFEGTSTDSLIHCIQEFFFPHSCCITLLKF